MLALIAAEQFPGFALAFYEPLYQAGQNQPPPASLALVADDAILLAPRQTAQGWEGFLIAEHTAADQPRVFHHPGDPQPIATLHVPPASGGAAAVWAEEAASLTTRQSRLAP
ncbi:MAG: hypothetical protein RLZZ124_1099 [Cyanobacteriota bacterium]